MHGVDHTANKSGSLLQLCEYMGADLCLSFVFVLADAGQLATATCCLARKNFQRSILMLRDWVGRSLHDMAYLRWQLGPLGLQAKSSNSISLVGISHHLGYSRELYSLRLSVSSVLYIVSEPQVPVVVYCRVSVLNSSLI